MDKHYPRQYLSPSQFVLFKRDKKAYFDRYLFGKTFSNKYTEFGKWVHGELEKPESENEAIEMIRPIIPECDKHELEVKAEINGVPLLGYIDKLNTKEKILIDIKTSKNPFSQQKADELEELTLYQLLIAEKLKFVPLRTYIVWLETADDGSGLYLTGKTKLIETKRTKEQLEYARNEIAEVWEEIGVACNKKLEDTFNGIGNKKTITL